MRIIKFRAWDKKEKIMYGEEELKRMYINFISGWVMNCRIDDGVDCEVMQYTGLKDKNGKEIYEGDIILEISTNELGVVYYIAPAYIGVIKNQDQFLLGAGFSYPSTRNELKDTEVIGDIYSNPELLKSEEGK